MKVLGRFFIYGMLLLCAFAGAREIPGKVMQAKQAIYKIKDQEGTATGFFIKPNIFVTNFHAIDKIKSLDEISLQKNNRSSIKINKLLAASSYVDLAVLQTKQTPVSYLSKGLPPEDDEDLFILGHLKGADDLKLMRKTGDIKVWLDLFYKMPVDFSGDASGMSGSPLLDSQGQFVGMVFGHNGNFSSSIISDYLEELLNGHVGTLCKKRAKSCIEKEIRLVQKHLTRHSNSDEIISGMTFFHTDLENFVQDSRLIRFYLFNGARQGYANAQYDLGVMYLEGKGVEQDSKQKTYWYKKAAKQGYAEAQYNLGNSYDKGEGVEQDYEKAAYWYKKAAEQGGAEAQYNLAVLYFYGNGVEESIERTVYWFTKSAEQGDEDAKNALDTLRSRDYID